MTATEYYTNITQLQRVRRSSALFAMAIMAVFLHAGTAGAITTSGLKFWLKTDGMSAGPVGTWSDSSGNNLHATQSVSTSKPTLVTNAMNGQSVVQFDGTSDHLYFDSWGLSGMTAGEIFCVLKVDDATPTTDKVLWFLGFPGSAVVCKYPGIDGRLWEAFGSNSPSKQMGKPVQDLEQYHVYSAQSMAGRFRVAINGLPEYEEDTNTVNFDGSFIVLGSHAYAGGGYFAGSIGEVILYSRVLTDTERIEVYDYLNSKFGLTSGTLSAPASLKCAPISSSQNVLCWNNPLTTYSLQYQVDRKTSSTDTYQQIAVISSELSWIDSTVTAGLECWYRIRARNGSATSSWSSETSCTALAAGIPVVPITTSTVWLKADSGTRPGALPHWRDATNNERSGLQLEAARQPLLVESVIAGKPVFRFDGTDDGFNLPAFCLNTLTQGEVYAVAKADETSPSVNRGLWFLGSGLNTAGHNYPATTGKVLEKFGRESSVIDTGYPVFPLNQPHIYDISAQNLSWYSRFNGKYQTYSAPNGVYFAGQEVNLGYGRSNDSTGNGYDFDGDLAEMIILNKVSRISERFGIYAYFMLKYGINDTDGDLMLDWWETSQFGNLNQTRQGDYDSDGFLNYEEFLFQSNPFLSDSDGDGLSDYNEVRFFNSDPILTDTDSDGIRDDYEVSYGLNPRVNDALLDPDQDGLYNIDEIDAEIRFGFYSNINNRDTNGDGIIDPVALRLGRDPSAADLDADGDSGTVEIGKGTSVIVPDTDRDAVNDPSDAFPHDPTRSTAPSTGGDTTAPTVIIHSPRYATY